jgi:hypothetical protein
VLGPYCLVLSRHPNMPILGERGFAFIFWFGLDQEGSFS